MICGWNKWQENFGLLKLRSNLAFMNVCLKCIVKQRWQWVMFNERQNTLRKLKQVEQHFMTNRAVVTLALQWCRGTTANGNCYTEILTALNACLCWDCPTRKMRLTFCSCMTTLSHTLVWASHTPSQIFVRQCCHMHPTVLVSHHQNTNSLSFKWKAARLPFASDDTLHNATFMAAGEGQQHLLGRNTCACSAVEEFSNTEVKFSYGLTLMRHLQIFRCQLSTVCRDVITFCMKYIRLKYLQFIRIDKRLRCSLTII
jgi:hypothetical protein